MLVIIAMTLVFCNSQGSMGTDNSEESPFKFALSVPYLNRLDLDETSIYLKTKQYVEKLEIAPPKFLQSYFSDYEEMNEHQKTGQVSKNILSSYKLIHRVSYYIPKIEDFFISLNSKISKEILQDINKIKSYDGIPNELDLEESIESILNLQDFHDLDSFEMAKNGKLLGKTATRISLKTQHCLEISKAALKLGRFTQAFQWLKAARELNNKETFDRKIFKELFEKIVDAHDAKFDASHLYSFERKLRDPVVSTSLKTVKDLLRKKHVGNLTTEKGIQNYLNFMALCQGNDLLKPEKRKKLNCFLDFKKHSYFTLMPLKTEILYNEPQVFQIYDAVSLDYMNKLMETAMKITRRVLNEDATRTPTYAWILPYTKDFPSIPIETRVNMMFGLDIGPDMLQINTYAAGAWVQPHIDFFDYSDGTTPPLMDGDDRLLATALFYLTDVEQGGETAFTFLGITAKPVKGSVIYWHTTLQNGEADKRMLHASCPVAIGHKWIFTKWIHRNSNFLKKPCTLNGHLIK